MAVEIEAKLRVDDHEAVRARLRAAGAAAQKKVMETNIFFDTEDRSLLAADKGLRLRVNHDLGNDSRTCIITYKGPRLHGPLKSREEIEVTVDSEPAAALLLERLGFARMLTFAKRRESWRLGGCQVELDELPCLGTFVEIEGPGEAEILHVKSLLHLTAAPPITASYVAMLMTYLQEHGIASRRITFEDRL
jgi:adenylate cyclase class 2